MIWFFRIYLCLWQALGTRNPVPNPGTAAQFVRYNPTTLMSQTTLHDPRFGLRSCKGEGCSDAILTAGATDWEQDFIQSAKYGQPPPMGSGPKPSPPRPTCVQKRSYKRACKRALRTGAAWYRGQLCTPAQFSPQMVEQFSQPTNDRPPHRNMPIRTSGMKHRFSCLHWNPGGLSQSSFLELKHWLRQHPVDVVTLVETRWSFSSCWQDDHWNYIHTATQEHRSGGILVMLAKRFISQEHIGHHVVVDGRFLHVRLHFARRALDLLTIYQHVDNRTTHNNRQRMGLWTRLTEYLGDLPSRNQLLCTGEFNCSLPQRTPWCGTRDFYWQGLRQTGPQHRDMDVFLTCLKQHSLVALNSWCPRSGPTYFHGLHASRIDFMISRLVTSCGTSKQVTYLEKADFLPMNSTHHIPMICTLMKPHAAYHVRHNIQACNYQQRSDCRQAALQETPNWTALQRITHQTLTQAAMDMEPTSQTIEQVHAQVTEQFALLFPTKRQSAVAQDNSAVHRAIHSKWFHHQQVRSHAHTPAKPLISRLIQVWYHWSQFRKLEKRQKHEARQARLNRFHDLCTDVQYAAHHNDPQRMFTIINRYTPKRAHARIRLRTATGAIADQYASHDILVQYVRDTWQGPELHPHSSANAPGSLLLKHNSFRPSLKFIPINQLPCLFCQL